MATHSSILAWRIPETGEPGGLPSMGSHRVGHNWSDLAEAVAASTTTCEHLTPSELESKTWAPKQTQPEEKKTNQTIELCSSSCLNYSLCSVAQSCLTLYSPMDCGLPGSFVHGSFQVRILEWFAISWPRDWICVSCIFCIGRQILYHWAT